jgi:hypothetical protein
MWMVALANTAIPLSGLPELLGAAGSLLALLGGAVALTFRPQWSPSGLSLRGLLVAGALAGAAAVFGLTLRVMALEFRPEAFRDLWTGAFFVLPAALSLSAVGVVWVRCLPGAPLRWLVLAWLAPPVAWVCLFGFLFVTGTLPGHF